MYIIAGLGNPTREYEKTRHNVGFEAVDVLADKLDARVTEKKAQSILWDRKDRIGKGCFIKTTDLYEPKRREYPGHGGFL